MHIGELPQDYRPGRLPPDMERQANVLGQVQLDPLAETPPPTAGDVKAQAVRLGDILLFGPLMVMGALGKETPQWMRAAMLVIGVGTIVYNAANFVEIEKRKGNVL